MSRKQATLPFLRDLTEEMSSDGLCEPKKNNSHCKTNESAEIMMLDDRGDLISAIVNDMVVDKHIDSTLNFCSKDVSDCDGSKGDSLFKSEPLLSNVTTEMEFMSQKMEPKIRESEMIKLEVEIPESGTVEPSKTLSQKSEYAYHTIGEASDLLGVPTHVLRFWEEKFSIVKPIKRNGGRRYYRPLDLERLKKIKELLYAQGYTIKGVQQIFKSQKTNIEHHNVNIKKKDTRELSSAITLKDQLNTILDEVKALRNYLKTQET